MDKILSLDLGTSYLKAVLFDRDGKLCGLHKASTPVAHPREGHWEMDTARFRESIAQLISQLVASSPNGLEEVAAVVFSTQSNTFLLLDSKDQPLIPLIVWADERAASFEDEVGNLSRMPGFHRTTGVPALDRLYVPAKLLWLRRQRPDVWRRAKRLCLISDYFTLWLTGQHVTEAGAAGLLGILDIHDLRWWMKACDQLALPESWLPTAVRAGTDLGPIRRGTADALGLPKGCRFIVGCLDQYAGAIGAGNISPGMVSETTGTILATVRCALGFDPSVGSAFFQGPSFDPSIYYQMLFGTTSANLLEWYRNGLPGPPDFDSLTRAAAGVPPGAEGLRVRPDADKGSLEDGFVGWSDRHTTGHAVRSIMETVAFALADQVEQLCGSERPAEVRSCGGAARSDVWLQIKADVLGAPFAATVCPEPTSLGAAMLAARTLGWAGLPDLVRDWVCTKPPCRCNPDAHKTYQRLSAKRSGTENPASGPSLLRKDVARMEKMTSRERLTAALRRQPVDRIPWTVDLVYYNDAMKAQGKLDPKYDGMDGFLRQHEELGVDPYYFYPCFWAHEDVYEGAKKETHQRTNETIHTYTLEGKTLTFVLRYMPGSYCWAHYKYPVTTVEELELFLRLLRSRRMVPVLERHRQMQREWGERGLLCVGAPRTPLPQIMAEWCGLTAASMLSFDAPDLFAEVLAEMDRIADPIFEAIAKFRPVVVHFPDNISGENVGSFWDKYMAPVYRRRLKQMHDAGIVCAIHNDGAMRNVLRRIASVGFDAAEALTPAPVGDVAVEDLRDLVGRDDFVLWGLVPGAAFSPAWSEAQFREYVSKTLAAVEGPFIMGSADQVPPDGDISRVRIVSEMLAQR